MYNLAGYIYVTVDSPTASAVEEDAEIGMVRTVHTVPGTERYSTSNGQLGLANHVASTPGARVYASGTKTISNFIDDQQGNANMIRLLSLLTNQLTYTLPPCCFFNGFLLSFPLAT